MQFAVKVNEGETDLLIKDADNEWWESKLSILITFSDWNIGCVIFSVATETWHHTSAELIHCEGHIEKKLYCFVFEQIASYLNELFD